MSARAIQTRLSDLTIRRVQLELVNPNAALGHSGRRLDREMDALRNALKAQLGEAA